MDAPRHQLRKKLEHHLDELPALPSVVVKLMGLDPARDTYFDDVRALIESAPNFSARLLATANSAAHAGVQPITTVGAAIARLGSRAAANLLLASSVTRVFVPRDDWEKSLWRHALQVAIAARALAQHAGDKELAPDELYAAGLLHDIGRFVMFQEAPEALRAVDEGQWHSPAELVAQERAICGLTHSELGARACEKWRLPSELAHVVREHHHPVPPRPTRKVDKIVALLRVADLAMFPSAMPGTPSLVDEGEPALEALAHKLPPWLVLPAPRLRDIVARSIAEADAVCAGLQLT